MTVDIHKYFLKHPKFNKLVGDDYLFVEYKCPLEVENFKLWTDTPILNYVISGKKDWTALEKTYSVEQGDALFIKQGVYNTKQYLENDYCVMLFFITEDFIRRFVNDNAEMFKGLSTKESTHQIHTIKVSDSLNTLI